MEDSYETTETYQENYKILLNLIERGEAMQKLLKIAQPVYIPKIHEALAGINKSIARTERILELQREIFIQTKIAEKGEAELLETAEIIEKELREYIAKHKPEKLEILEAMLSDDDKTH